MYSTLTQKQIAQDLLSNSNTNIEVQKQAGQLLLNLLTPKLPEVVELTKEQKLELAEREKAQNAPKNCECVQLLSVPEQYRQNYPDLFNLIAKKVNSEKDKTITIETKVQKITWNNLIVEADLQATSFEIIADKDIAKNYKLQPFFARQADDKDYNFEEARFPVKLIFDSTIKFEFEFYDCYDNVAQYLFVQAN